MSLNGMLPLNKNYLCELKSREEMEKTISMDQLGWWHDCLPGAIVELRQATLSDIEASWIRKENPKNPEHYMMQVIENGRLILKKAIKRHQEGKVNLETIPMMDLPVDPDAPKKKEKAPVVPTNKLPENFRKRLKEKNRSIADCWMATGISYSTLCDWHNEKCKAQVADKRLKDLATFLETTVDWLLFGDEEMKELNTRKAV